MQPARHPVSRRRHARRLAVSSVVLASLAGTALGFQGTAAAVGLGRTRLTEPIPKAAPGLPRLDPRLAQLARSPQGHPGPARPRRVELGVSLQQGRVRVEVLARDARAAARAVRSLGGKIRMTLGSHVEALMPPASLAALSREASVGFVRLPEKGTLEAVSGEEVNASLASALQAKGITGKGVKVAIIDGGFMGLPSLQVTGDVPTQRDHRGLLPGRFLQRHGARRRRHRGRARDGPRRAALPRLLRTTSRLSSKPSSGRRRTVRRSSTSRWATSFWPRRRLGAGRVGGRRRARRRDPVGERGRQPRSGALERQLDGCQRQRLPRLRARRRDEQLRAPERRRRVRRPEVGRVADGQVGLRPRPLLLDDELVRGPRRPPRRTARSRRSKASATGTRRGPR